MLELLFRQIRFRHYFTAKRSQNNPVSTKLTNLPSIPYSNSNNAISTTFSKISLSQTLSFAQTLLNARGTVFFSGVGKCVNLATAISNILTSSGVRSSFLSPLDALHGDIGAVSSTDVLVLLSKSGSSEELLRLVPFARAKGAYLVSLTSVEGNALSAACDMNVHLPVQRELCPFNLAPVTCTPIQMLFGATVATALMGARDFTMEKYAANHPAGKIGKRLVSKVKDVMKKGDEVPVCKEGDLIMEQLVELTRKSCGCLLVTDEDHHLIGTFMDGDLRRTLKASRDLIFNLTVGEMCNRNPRTISADAMTVEAVEKMESPSSVQFLPVVNDQNLLIGIVTLHGLVSAGL